MTEEWSESNLGSKAARPAVALPFLALFRDPGGRPRFRGPLLIRGEYEGIPGTERTWAYCCWPSTPNMFECNILEFYRV